MIKLKYLLPVLVLILSTFATVLFSSKVSAASTWQQTNSVYVENSSQAYNVDWTPIVSDYNLLNAIAFANSNTNPGSTCSSDEFTFAMTDGYISVSQYVINGSPSFWGEKSISIHYNKTGPTPSGTTFVASGFIDPPSPATHHASIVYRGDIGLLATCSASPPDYYPVANSPGNINYNFSVLYSTFPAIYDTGYDGDPVPESPPFVGTTVYPTMSIIVLPIGGTDASKVKVTLLDEWMDRYNLPIPDYIIFTLTEMDDTIIVADRCWGPSGCDWDHLVNGDYKMRLDVVYNSTSINDNYSFPTTEVWFQVNGTSYTLVYNPNEDKYCTVRNGYEWNCDIPQPGDDPSLITGEPEIWDPQECVLPDFPWVDLGACVNNVLHYLGEYLGINGPSIQPGSSPFFQFDTNTFGLTAIITTPITILNSLSLGEYVCNPVNLPLPYLEGDLVLPCMQSYYNTYLGALYTMWQVVINGIVSYYVIVGLLRMVKDAKDPQKDQIEVLKL